MSESMRQELAKLRKEMADAERKHRADAREAAKRSAIGMAMARAQIKDPNRVYDAIAAQVIENHDGRWVTAENGVSKFGPDEGATYSLDRLVADVAGSGAKAGETSSPGKESADEPNPFVPGPHFNLTAQMVLWRTDETKAAHLEYLAGMGRK